MKNTMLNPNFNYPSINYHLYHPYHSEYRLDQYHSIAISKMQASRPSQAISYKDSLMFGLSIKSRNDIKKNRKLSGITDSVRSSDKSSENSKNQPNYYEDNLAEVKNTNPTRIINRSNNHGSLSRISIENLIN